METMDLIVENIPTTDADLILNTFNDTDYPFDEDITIQELFEKQVKRNPDSTAVIFEDGVLTYSELNNRVNALALHLRKNGVVRDKIVGIMCERSFEMIIGILGIIKAGGAYMPISVTEPVNRINLLMEDSCIDLLVIQNKFSNKISFGGTTIILDDFKDIKEPHENLPIINKSTDLVYIIYTSGSTGLPKGVMIEHKSLINRLFWMQRAYPINEDDVILQKTPFNFDVSVWELFWWQIIGAKVCFLSPGAEKNPIALINTIEKYKVSVMHFVPSMLGVFLEYLSDRDIEKQLYALRLVFASGEALPARYVNLFNSKLNYKNNRKLINLYGPTEATIDVTHYDCSLGEIHNKIPIGKPIDNTKIYITDGNHNLLGVNEEGELLIAGTGLARGYLNKGELTSQKFIDNHFTSSGKMYKTGDMVKWTEDGNIEFIDRMDNQVKIRGLRIELGEIESVLLKHPAINDCIIHTKKHTESVIIIIAYYIASQIIDPKELKSFLRLYLPDYMVPNQFMKLDAIPLSPNGKADRKALPDLPGNKA